MTSNSVHATFDLPGYLFAVQTVANISGEVGAAPMSGGISAATVSGPITVVDAVGPITLPVLSATIDAPSVDGEIR